MTNREIVHEYFKNGLTLFDDIMFRVVAQNKGFVEELLKVFLNDKKLKLISSEVQKDMSFYDSKGIILDCYCKLSSGRIVSIEIERNDKLDKCNHQKRVRYYGSAINIKNLKKGEKYDELPDVYMIYLTLKDFFKLGKSAYHIDRVIGECGKVVDNGYHEIYINAEINDRSDISEVMKMLSTNDYVNSNYKIISDVKEDLGMPVEVERAIEGLKQEGQFEMIARLIKKGLISEKDAASVLNISLIELKDKIKELM